jgi:hypothetical protein
MGACQKGILSLNVKKTGFKKCPLSKVQVEI